MPQATCSNLGIFDGEKYLPEPDCVECVKDLIRFLRYKPAGKVMRLKAQTQHVVTSHFYNSEALVQVLHTGETMKIIACVGHLGHLAFSRATLFLSSGVFVVEIL